MLDDWILAMNLMRGRKFITSCVGLCLLASGGLFLVFMPHNAQATGIINPFAYNKDITFLTSLTSDTPNITIPASSQAGDLAVLMDLGASILSTPSLVIPAGWTQIWAGNAYLSLVGYRGAASYKILQAGDPGSSITGINGGFSEYKNLIIFRGISAISSVTIYDLNGIITAGNPPAYTASARTPPYIVFAWAASLESPPVASFDGTPDFEGKVLNVRLGSAWWEFNFAETGISVSADLDDEGLANSLGIFSVVPSF